MAELSSPLLWFVELGRVVRINRFEPRAKLGMTELRRNLSQSIHAEIDYSRFRFTKP
jgi:hypothetical protein